jgi:hypothetical protein
MTTGFACGDCDEHPLAITETRAMAATGPTGDRLRLRSVEAARMQDVSNNRTTRRRSVCRAPRRRDAVEDHAVVAADVERARSLRSHLQRIEHDTRAMCDLHDRGRVRAASRTTSFERRFNVLSSGNAFHNSSECDSRRSALTLRKG